MPIATASRLELSIQAPFELGSPVSLAQPDAATVPTTLPDSHPSTAG